MYKILIAGSREFRDSQENAEVRAAVVARVAELDKEFDGKDILIICGGARGVDKWAENAAEARDIMTHVEKARWHEGSFYNPLAGFERNSLMVDMSPDLAIIFWDGYSGGTQDTITKLEAAGIEIEMHVYGEGKL